MWSPTPIQKLVDQLVEIQVTQVGDEHYLDIEKRAILQQPVDMV